MKAKRVKLSLHEIRAWIPASYVSTVLAKTLIDEYWFLPKLVSRNAVLMLSMWPSSARGRNVTAVSTCTSSDHLRLCPQPPYSILNPLWKLFTRERRTHH